MGEAADRHKAEPVLPSEAGTATVFLKSADYATQRVPGTRLLLERLVLKKAQAGAALRQKHVTKPV